MGSLSPFDALPTPTQRFSMIQGYLHFPNDVARFSNKTNSILFHVHSVVFDNFIQLIYEYPQLDRGNGWKMGGHGWVLTWLNSSECEQFLTCASHIFEDDMMNSKTCNFSHDFP